eukprot:472683-Pyramimonas_sp.AAC.1
MAPKLPTAVVTAIARPAAVLVTNGTYLAFSSPPSTHVYLSALERSNEQASRRHHVRYRKVYHAQLYVKQGRTF